jgi:predicted NBD/HSP70 family sugar kinase
VSGLPDRAVALLTAAHATPGLTRAEASRLLGIGSGAATEVVGRLSAERLVAEGPPTSGGGRGRPTRPLLAHPEGPVVLAAVITHEGWRVDAVALGNAPLAGVAGRHTGAPATAVLADLGRAVADLRSRFGDRVRGLGIGGPGLVVDERYLTAPGLGWTDVDLAAVWPGSGLVVADNDATLAALAESTRGAAVGARLALHLRVDAGLGGALVEDGRLVAGAGGTAGEFGHLPMGDPAVHCPCGASGCWGTAVDGGALARLLGEPEPPDPVTYARQVLARAGTGNGAARAAVAVAAQALGRGIAGLVNALDPDVVTLGGLGADLLAAAPDDLDAACRAGLMRFRRATPPPVVRARLDEDGPLTGAAERVWRRLWWHLRR